MTHPLKIGDEFMTETGSWCVTDVGSRVIVAIKLRDDTSWHNGPPYAVEEVVFDEEDIAALDTPE